MTVPVIASPASMLRDAATAHIVRAMDPESKNNAELNSAIVPHVRETLELELSDRKQDLLDRVMPRFKAAATYGEKCLALAALPPSMKEEKEHLLSEARSVTVQVQTP